MNRWAITNRPSGTKSSASFPRGDLVTLKQHRRRFTTLFATAILALLFSPPLWAQSPAVEHFRRWTELLEQRAPQHRDQCTVKTIAEVREAADAVELWSLDVGQVAPASTFEAALQRTAVVLDIKRRVDTLTDRTLDLRRSFAGANDTAGRDGIRAFLAMSAQLLDLSGRLRFQLADTLRGATRLATSDAQRIRLVDELIKYRSTIGAITVAPYLNDSTPVFGNERAGREQLQRRVLELMAVSGQSSMIGPLDEFLERQTLPASLAIAAAETVRAIGLPQVPRPGTPDDLPTPPITANSLLARMKSISPLALDDDLRKRHEALLRDLTSIAEKGLSEPIYRVGAFDVRPGDWLLMRNPSPFNMFTDLTPGLFTHVGVVALEDGSDGIRRMVLVDMPERGRTMPATTIDTYLLRTLNYLFVRHNDRAVGDTMSDAARSMIDNEIEFDLNFRTERVAALKGQPLKGRKIQTYCAGFLLLCALQTDSAREAFFPVPEYPAGDQTLKNLERLGMSIGDNFISPTGALFSDQMQIVGRREPMYDPRREVEEAVFDHFALGMREKSLNAAAELFNDLRVKMAEAAKSNPLLSQALAQANNVSADLDLVSAAKAAAVIDTLDEVAFGASGEFVKARGAVFGPSSGELRRRGAPAKEIEQAEQYRTRHLDLVKQLSAGSMQPHEIGRALVKHYISRGKAEIDRRFFGVNNANTNR